MGVDARVDRAPFTNQNSRKKFLYNMGRAHIIGEVGCYASHYLIWQNV
ncbi:hypothetical protein O9993_04225 [Vibrio lentus]|nr:hypothetical protein [Vibrio lentus]